MLPYFRFEILHQSKKSRARVGVIHTPHGIIETPHFVAVGTNGILKSLENTLIDEMNLQLMFCNTYHLILQPGTEIVKQAGGLHSFIQRTRPIITDSGGFQVFSLAYKSVHDELKSKGKKQDSQSVLKISEEGVVFRSYRDGKKIHLTPESSVQAQKDLGADIIIPLDELLPYHTDEKSVKESLARTHRWQVRSLQEHLKEPKKQAMYGVIHGGISPELRKTSCMTLLESPFDGLAIGGSLGKNHRELQEVVSWTRQFMPNEIPNHLLGIGDLKSLELLIPEGIDTFDSSYPTKVARHGLLFTDEGGVRIQSGRYANSFEPISNNCHCLTCKKYTKAYLHHLFKAHEISAYSLASIHNIQYMISLMKKYREMILNDLL